jgi:DNA repair ATPase RecN
MSPVFISTAESGLRSDHNSDAAVAATPRCTARDDGWTNMVFLTNVEVVGHTRGEGFDTQRCISSENLSELIMPDEVVSLIQENENVLTERTSFDLDLHELWLANEEEMLVEYAAKIEDAQQQLAESRQQRTESWQQLAESRRQRTERRQQWTEMEQRVAKMEQQLLEIRQQLMETRQQLTETRQQLTETGQDLTETWKELGQLSPVSMIWSIARDKSADGLELLLPKTC